MKSMVYPSSSIEFDDHPKFAGVKISALVSSKESDVASVCFLDIEKNTTVPVHTHDPQVDSIYIVSGAGEIYANGQWNPIVAGDYIFVPAGDEHGIKSGDEGLRLFVHHSPPLL